MQVLIDTMKNLNNATNRTIKLLKYTQNKGQEIKYYCHEIWIKDQKILDEFLTAFADTYINENNQDYKLIDGVREFDGEIMSSKINFISIKDELINEQYKSLLKALAKSSCEENPLKIKCQGYIMEMQINDSNIKIITLNNPVKNLKNAFFISDGELKESKTKFLQFHYNACAIVVDDIMYILNTSIEKLFGLDSSYKKNVNKKLEEINSYDILSDKENFNRISLKGHNPRRFLSFNNDNLVLLNDKERLQNISNAFHIEFHDGKIDTNGDDNCEKLIKLLCNKAAISAFSNEPIEISTSKKWG